MLNVLLIDNRPESFVALDRELGRCSSARLCGHLDPANDRELSAFRRDGIDAIVYSPSRGRRPPFLPDLKEAEEVLKLVNALSAESVVVISNAAVYGADPHNPGLMTEECLSKGRKSCASAEAWSRLERIAQDHADVRRVLLTVLRCAETLSASCLTSMLSGKRAFVPWGFDPSIQVLASEDQARAVRCALEADTGGVFNIAPREVVPLSVALRSARTTRIPIPTTLKRLFGAIRRSRANGIGDFVDYLRFSWTISDARAREALGYLPEESSLGTIRSFFSESHGHEPRPDVDGVAFDDFGLDREYIDAKGRSLLNFLEKYYWRIEVAGLENLPREGPAVVVGNHRGFMPWDGIMIIHLMTRYLGRVPRFLAHPSLIKLPVVGRFITRLGSIFASQTNADRLLKRDEIVAIFPEGIRGAFTPYRQRYKLARFGRKNYVSLALRNKAPIVPFVIVGSAETYPILGKIEWNWLRRKTEWPYFPITPTFPHFPLPLPSKWHIQFLPPVEVDKGFTPDARTSDVVRSINDEVRARIERALEQILLRRKSVFFGSVFAKDSSS